jgi:hypothetical protein
MEMRQRFSKEFKLEAVRLLELGQKPAAQLALELGVRRNQLLPLKLGAEELILNRRWKPRLRARAGLGRASGTRR